MPAMDRSADSLESLVLETQAKSLEGLVAHQVQQLEDARRALSRTNARIGALKNSRTPMYSLPNELWLYIVKLAQRSSSTSKGRERPEIAMSHISSRWRNVVINAPTLWTHIGSASMPLATDLLEMYLRRSQPCTISVVLAPAKSFESGRDRLVQLVHHVDRLEDLSLHGVGANPLYSQVLHSLRAPKLKALRIYWTGTDLPRKISPFTGGAPILSVLDLDNCFFDDESSSIISSVTMFRQQFTTTTTNFITWPSESAIAHMAWLTKLEVCVDDLCEVGPYDIPSLRSFSLNFRDYEEVHVPLNFFPISSPCLESLLLESCHGDQIMSVFNRLGSSRSQKLYPNLHSLVLWSCHSYGSCSCKASDIPHPDISNAIHTFSSISHISCVNVCHQGLILRMLLRDAVEIIQPTSHATLPWTNLQSVTVSPIHMASFGELFKLRKDSGYPISKLRVTKDGFSDIANLSSEDRAEVPEVEIFDEGEFLGSLQWDH